MADLRNDPRIRQAATAINADTSLIAPLACQRRQADFTSAEKFARDYPGMLQYGITSKIGMMANFLLGRRFSGAITCRTSLKPVSTTQPHTPATGN